MHIGWTHLSCVFWNLYCEFVDETRFEIKQDARLKLYKTQVCKYCDLETTVFKATSCGFKKVGMRCSRPFHVMCAIKRGLITDWETMKHFQTINGRVVAMCSLHTRGRRQLSDMNDMSHVANAVLGQADAEMEAVNDDDRLTNAIDFNDEDTFH